MNATDQTVRQIKIKNLPTLLKPLISDVIKSALPVIACNVFEFFLHDTVHIILI